jgi:hypothetical protein
VRPSQFPSDICAKFGELVPFLRYDLAYVSVFGSAPVQALGVGINFNFPFTRKLANLHLEYTRKMMDGSKTILTSRGRDFDALCHHAARFEHAFHIVRRNILGFRGLGFR